MVFHPGLGWVPPCLFPASLHRWHLLPGEAFDGRSASCLWLVGRLQILSTALRCLGDRLEQLRSAEHLGVTSTGGTGTGQDVNRLGNKMSKINMEDSREKLEVNQAK